MAGSIAGSTATGEPPLTPIRHWRTLDLHFIEAVSFTRRRDECLDDEAYRMLQIALIRRPGQGRIMQGSAGLRKVRWGSASSGKRGGVRIIYYWEPQRSTVFCLYVYRKNVQGDLTTAQVRALRTLVKEEFG